MVLVPLKQPRVAGALMTPVQKSGCLRPDQNEYSVLQLEEGYRCLQEHSEEIEEQLSALQRAVRARERANVRKSQSTKRVQR